MTTPERPRDIYDPERMRLLREESPHRVSRYFCRIDEKQAHIDFANSYRREKLNEIFAQIGIDVQLSEGTQSELEAALNQLTPEQLFQVQTLFKSPHPLTSEALVVPIEKNSSSYLIADGSISFYIRRGGDMRNGFWNKLRDKIVSSNPTAMNFPFTVDATTKYYKIDLEPILAQAPNPKLERALITVALADFTTLLEEVIALPNLEQPRFIANETHPKLFKILQKTFGFHIAEPFKNRRFNQTHEMVYVMQEEYAAVLENCKQRLARFARTDISQDSAIIGNARRDILAYTISLYAVTSFFNLDTE